MQAAKKEDVLNALSRIAGTFRTRIGESLATVKEHDTPLEEATTPSLEALRAFSAASKHLYSDTDLAAAVPLFKEAIEADPKFAMAHASLGFTYGLLGQLALSATSNTKAYELRDRASYREKLFITAIYELQVTGNLEKARQTCELWLQTYPRDKVPHGLLGALLYPTFGQYDKGIEAATRLVEFDPDFPVGYLQLAFNNQFAGHLDEAEHALRRASDRKLEIPELLLQRYDMAFLGRPGRNGPGSGSGPERIRRRRHDRRSTGFCPGVLRPSRTSEVDGAAGGRPESAGGPAWTTSADRNRPGAVGCVVRECVAREGARDCRSGPFNGSGRGVRRGLRPGCLR